MLKIEKNIPVPLTSYRKKSDSKWSAIDTMEIGDSFEIKCPSTVKAREKFRANIIGAFNARKMKCSIRRVADDKFRVWRVSKYEKKNAKIRAVN